MTQRINMKYPDFYMQIPPIKLYDPLSAFLGAFEDGLMEISYLECVKLAGHSCPTVAGAYLMASKGLESLYGSDIPQRGTIKVEMQKPENDGVTGVIANIISFITGANGVGGFKGIQGKFSRNNLLKYNVPIQGKIRLTRVDTNESVTLSYDPSSVMPDAMMQPLMGKSLQGLASKEEQEMFGRLWQKRVEEILLYTDDTKLLTITKD